MRGMVARPSSCPSCGLALPEGAQDCPHCSAQTVDLRTPFPPISGYKMIHALGEGGMGAVYLASDETLGRRVAVKVISRRYASDAESSARFLREARSMATVEHPHIVRVYAFGESEGQPYLVMEYVEGEDLALRVKRDGPLGVGEALRILRQVVEALDAAWEQKIVHRDIKPSNILLDKRGRVRVADFGLAKPMRMEGDATLSAKTYVLGTPHYAAPEQIRGRDVDFRSDIYSLGIVLYEMLAGERPFEGSTPFDVIDKQVREPLPALKKKRPDTPEEVVQLLDWMTQKNPAQRPASYAELLGRVDALLGVLPVTPPPSSVTTPVPERKPRFYPAFIALAVLAVAAAGWFAWTRFREPAPNLALPGAQLVVAITPFYGPDEDSAKEGKVMAALVERAIAQKLGKENAKILGGEETKQPVRDHAAARALGERLGANVVVWGEAFTLRGETEIQPYFTMVPPKKAEEKSPASFGTPRTISGSDPLAALQERATSAMVVQATAPNQIQLRKTTAEGVGEMAMFLAGLHALYTANDPPKALRFFELTPRTAESLRYRGEALLRLNRKDEAVASLREAVKLDPRAAQAQAMLGDLELEAGHLREAAAAYRAAAAIGGEYVTKNGFVLDGQLYAREDRKDVPGAEHGSGLIYVLQLDPETGRVRERYSLPGVATSFRPKGDGIEIEYPVYSFEFATLRFARGKFDRPVLLGTNLMTRRRAWQAGVILAQNFLSDISQRRKEQPTRFARQVKPARAGLPTTIEALEAAARAAIENDPTQPGYLFVLGQALWALDKKAEAEQEWARMFGAGFPAIPHYVFAWMASDFENLNQRAWADRAYAEALKRRKAMAQPIGTSLLIERLISARFVAIAATRSRSGQDLERAYVWLERTREIAGPCIEGEDVAAAAWEKYFASRGELQKAQHEAAVREKAGRHTANGFGAAMRVDLALYAAAAFTLSFFGSLGLVLARARERCKAARLSGSQQPPAAPGAARSATGYLVRLLWLILLVAGAGLLLLAGPLMLWSEYTGQYAVGGVLIALGLGMVGLFVYRWKKGPLLKSQVSPGKLVAAVTRAERALVGAALAAVLLAMGILAHYSTALYVLAGLPFMMDSIGHAEVTWSLEARLKDHDTPARRYVAAVSNHMGGNIARARTLYESLPRDERAQRNLAALLKGDLAPPVPLTNEEIHAAAKEFSWKGWLRGLWLSGLGWISSVGEADVVTAAAPVLFFSALVALLLGVFLLVAFWRIHAREPEAGRGVGERRNGRVARVCLTLIPGAFDLRRGSVWRGYVALTLASLVLLVGCARIAVRSWQPGIVSFASSHNFRAYPLPTPAGLANDEAVAAYYYWTFFWAYPYAREFWIAVALAALVALGMHITRLRMIWRS